MIRVNVIGFKGERSRFLSLRSLRILIFRTEIRYAAITAIKFV